MSLASCFATGVAWRAVGVAAVVEGASRVDCTLSISDNHQSIGTKWQEIWNEPGGNSDRRGLLTEDGLEADRLELLLPTLSCLPWEDCRCKGGGLDVSFRSATTTGDG